MEHVMRVRQDSRDDDAGVYATVTVSGPETARRYSINNDAMPIRVDVMYGAVAPWKAPAVIAAPYIEVAQPTKANGYRTGEALYAHIFPDDDWRHLPPSIRALYQVWASGPGA